MTDETEGSLESTYDQLRDAIKAEFLAHLKSIDAVRSISGDDPKAAIRSYHRWQRIEYRTREAQFTERYGQTLLGRHFATGSELLPERVDPLLCAVNADSEDSLVFRLATLLWSVPVSRGYGRRMRFLVRDKSNGKLIGIFGLADPVFNLRARDEWIGWSVDDRRQRLVNVMDAYVVGAVPPYSQLLGGKVVASLMTSQEVCQSFTDRYSDTSGIISMQQKHSQLVLITVTSALGRSSLYNRLTLPDVVAFLKVGKTGGWGHFQVPQDLFTKMRRLLELDNHPYASGHRFGMGPNWRMRVIREALERVGLDGNLLRHGIEREIYAAPLTSNWRELLLGQTATRSTSRPSAAEIGQLAVVRWLVPRAARRPEYKSWTLSDTWNALTRDTDNST